MADAQNAGVEYVAAALGMNPLENPHEILEARAAFRGVAPRVPTPHAPAPHAPALGVSGESSEHSSPSDPPQPVPAPDIDADTDGPERYEVAESLEELRDRFWDLTAAEFDAGADDLDVDGFPDLAAALRRLREVSALRADVTAAEAAPHVDEEFFCALRHILVATPRHAIMLRDEFSKLLESGLPIRPVHRSVKLIKRRCPQLYAREADWMDFLLRFKKERRMMTKVASRWWIWILILMVLRAIAKWAFAS